MAEDEVAERQTDNRIAAPRVEAPVHEAGPQREQHRLVGHGLDARHGCDVVGKRFGCAPEHEANAHSGREQHGEPAERALCGLLVVSTELRFAVGAYRQNQRKDDERRHSKDVKPVEVRGQSAHGRVRSCHERVAGSKAPDDQGDCQRNRNDKHQVFSGFGEKAFARFVITHDRTLLVAVARHGATRSDTTGKRPAGECTGQAQLEGAGHRPAPSKSAICCA